MLVQPITNLMTSAFGNVWNKYFQNNPDVWDRMYQRDYSRKLDSDGQQARNFVLAGIIHSSGIACPRVLDVGCGNGSLLRLMGRQPIEYFGLDLSTTAIEEARDKWANKYPNAEFEVADFRSLSSSDPRLSEKFDFVVFNEVLYYFPLEDIEGVLENARSHLAPKGEILISMSENPKAQIIWRRCLTKLAVLFEHYVQSGMFTAWKVKAFR
jgi:2-polyprenyl-3-methyl-5-hydroxy-6-metoxy-1,4-benzoquinol methylase